ncbi:MAG: hypothetical protein JWR38_418 [Mucilaginibacter sp.]|nr:hypothetical protein [Mucilaginibacter sp.]
MKAILTKVFIIAALILGYFNIAPFAQAVKQNTALIKHIDSMFKDDQFWRKEFGKTQRKEKSVYSDETIQKKWAEADSINELKAKAIIKKYGYPGYNLVGETSNKFWAIVQHCDDDIPFQEHVLALMKKEIARNNVDKANYALLTDRVLANKHQKQIYGTQVNVDPKTHKATPLPLKYPKEVNKLRKQMGMEPLEKYLKSYE